ncbi:hypothetical protein KO527_24100 [Pseudoalteromonas sp. C2R02]|uniref:hypothetical protein n=1 Tax=Pseudoalteromonas sp. C2R02 TaxID=2841565 RepID=UPI001C0A2634|nr:hypothetical protein [Pseudoalteromonas sp. C2R02]MBU2972421.1 hypothetical protein [Pseudoalteromonas sp. C2R02]
MEVMRESIALIFFIFGITLIYLVFNTNQWEYVLGAILSFTTAFLIWPSKKRGQREQENHFLDVLELIIEFPIELIFWLFRILGRIFKGKDGSIDIDLDI